MKTFVLLAISLALTFWNDSKAQTTYTDSLESFRTKYILEHEVVKGDAKQKMKFFPIDGNYRVFCTFKPLRNAPWFSMQTSTGAAQQYRRFGTLSFKLKDTALTLQVYQSQSLMNTEDYFDYLFIPFTDETTGIDSYESGRYLECSMKDIKNNTLVLDFNKAYNPYCAYAPQYSCPIPPRENHLAVFVYAGEREF